MPLGFIVNRRSKLWVSSSKPPLPSLLWVSWVFPTIQALGFFFFLLLFLLWTAAAGAGGVGAGGGCGCDCGCGCG